MDKERKAGAALSFEVEPAVAGFLYSKMMLAEKAGIEVICEAKAPETDKFIKTSDLVEVTGILLDNAIDAMKTYDKPKIIVRLTVQENGIFIVEIANTSRIFADSELAHFCECGYSSKGDGRGLGLARLKVIADQYGADFTIHNKKIDGRNYLDFLLIFNLS